jgi:hypothetical protein
MLILSPLRLRRNFPFLEPSPETKRTTSSNVLHGIQELFRDYYMLTEV